MRPPIRAFIAIELSERVKRELSLVQERLKAAEADVKWSNPQHLHLTLKFLGDIQPEILDDVEEAIARTAAASTVFHMDIGILAAFPRNTEPKIIWAGLSKRANYLMDMAKKLEAELQEFDIKLEDRGFMPHITLGRNRTETVSKPLAKLLENTHIPSGLSQKVERIALFRSELLPKGPAYHLLYSTQLHKE